MEFFSQEIAANGVASTLEKYIFDEEANADGRHMLTRVVSGAYVVCVFYLEKPSKLQIITASIHLSKLEYVFQVPLIIVDLISLTVWCGVQDRHAFCNWLIFLTREHVVLYLYKPFFRSRSSLHAQSHQRHCF